MKTLPQIILSLSALLLGLNIDLNAITICNIESDSFIKDTTFVENENFKDTMLFRYSFSTYTTEYSYEYQIFQEDSDHNLKYISVLLKNGEEVDRHELKSFNQSILKGNNVSEIRPLNINRGESIGIISNKGYGEIWDGYSYQEMLFGVYEGKLIQEMILNNAGYSLELGGISIDMNSSFITSEYSPFITIRHEFFTRFDIENIRYDYIADSEHIISNGILKPIYDIEKVVVSGSKSINVRYSPFEDESMSNTAGIINPGEEISVLEKSEFEISLIRDGKELKGKWCKIEFPTNYDSIGYVFDADLK